MKRHCYCGHPRKWHTQWGCDAGLQLLLPEPHYCPCLDFEEDPNGDEDEHPD